MDQTPTSPMSVRNTRRMCIGAIPLTIVVLGEELAICVVDPHHAPAAGECRTGVPGSIVRMRGVGVVSCSCAGWADTGACLHALKIRAVIIDLKRDLRVAVNWPDTHGYDVPLPVGVRRAVALASLLVKPGARVEPGMLTGRAATL